MSQTNNLEKSHTVAFKNGGIGSERWFLIDMVPEIADRKRSIDTGQVPGNMNNRGNVVKVEDCDVVGVVPET